MTSYSSTNPPLGTHQLDLAVLPRLAIDFRPFASTSSEFLSPNHLLYSSGSSFIIHEFKAFSQDAGGEKTVALQPMAFLQLDRPQEGTSSNTDGTHSPSLPIHKGKLHDPIAGAHPIGDSIRVNAAIAQGKLTTTAFCLHKSRRWLALAEVVGATSSLSATSNGNTGNTGGRGGEPTTSQSGASTDPTTGDIDSHEAATPLPVPGVPSYSVAAVPSDFVRISIADLQGVVPSHTYTANPTDDLVSAGSASGILLRKKSVQSEDDADSSHARDTDELTAEGVKSLSGRVVASLVIPCRFLGALQGRPNRPGRGGPKAQRLRTGNRRDNVEERRQRRRSKQAVNESLRAMGVVGVDDDVSSEGENEDGDDNGREAGEDDELDGEEEETEEEREKIGVDGWIRDGIAVMPEPRLPPRRRSGSSEEEGGFGVKTKPEDALLNSVYGSKDSIAERSGRVEAGQPLLTGTKVFNLISLMKFSSCGTRLVLVGDGPCWPLFIWDWCGNAATFATLPSPSSSSFGSSHHENTAGKQSVFADKSVGALSIHDTTTAAASKGLFVSSLRNESSTGSFAAADASNPQRRYHPINLTNPQRKDKQGNGFGSLGIGSSSSSSGGGGRLGSGIGMDGSGVVHASHPYLHRPRYLFEPVWGLEWHPYQSDELITVGKSVLVWSTADRKHVKGLSCAPIYLPPSSLPAISKEQGDLLLSSASSPSSTSSTKWFGNIGVDYKGFAMYKSYYSPQEIGLPVGSYSLPTSITDNLPNNHASNTQTPRTPSQTSSSPTDIVPMAGGGACGRLPLTRALYAAMSMPIVTYLRRHPDACVVAIGHYLHVYTGLGAGLRVSATSNVNYTSGFTVARAQTQSQPHLVQTLNLCEQLPYITAMCATRDGIAVGGPGAVVLLQYRSRYSIATHFDTKGNPVVESTLFARKHPEVPDIIESLRRKSTRDSARIRRMATDKSEGLVTMKVPGEGMAPLNENIMDYTEEETSDEEHKPKSNRDSKGSVTSRGNGSRSSGDSTKPPIQRVILRASTSRAGERGNAARSKQQATNDDTSSSSSSSRLPSSSSGSSSSSSYPMPPPKLFRTQTISLVFSHEAPPSKPDMSGVGMLTVSSSRSLKPSLPPPQLSLNTLPSGAPALKLQLSSSSSSAGRASAPDAPPPAIPTSRMYTPSHLTASQDGTVVSVSCGSTRDLLVFSVTSAELAQPGKASEELCPVRTGVHSKRVVSADSAEEEPILVTCDPLDRSVRLYNTDTGACMHVRRYNTSTPIAVAISPNGSTVLVSLVRSVLVLRVLVNSMAIRQELSLTNITFMKFSHGGQLVAFIQGSDVLIYVAATMKPLHILTSVCECPQGVQWGPDDDILVILGTNGYMSKWLLRAGGIDLIESHVSDAVDYMTAIVDELGHTAVSGSARNLVSGGGDVVLSFNCTRARPVHRLCGAYGFGSVVHPEEIVVALASGGSASVIELAYGGAQNVAEKGDGDDLALAGRQSDAAGAMQGKRLSAVSRNVLLAAQRAALSTPGSTSVHINLDLGGNRNSTGLSLGSKGMHDGGDNSSLTTSIGNMSSTSGGGGGVGVGDSLVTRQYEHTRANGGHSSSSGGGKGGDKQTGGGDGTPSLYGDSTSSTMSHIRSLYQSMTVDPLRRLQTHITLRLLSAESGNGKAGASKLPQKQELEWLTARPTEHPSVRPGIDELHPTSMNISGVGAHAHGMDVLSMASAQWMSASKDSQGRPIPSRSSLLWGLPFVSPLSVSEARILDTLSPMIRKQIHYHPSLKMAILRVGVVPLLIAGTPTGAIHVYPWPLSLLPANSTQIQPVATLQLHACAILYLRASQKRGLIVSVGVDGSIMTTSLGFLVTKLSHSILDLNAALLHDKANITKISPQETSSSLSSSSATTSENGTAPLSQRRKSLLATSSQLPTFLSLSPGLTYLCHALRDRVRVAAASSAEDQADAQGGGSGAGDLGGDTKVHGQYNDGLKTKLSQLGIAGQLNKLANQQQAAYLSKYTDSNASKTKASLNVPAAGIAVSQEHLQMAVLARLLAPPFSLFRFPRLSSRAALTKAMSNTQLTLLASEEAEVSRRCADAMAAIGSRRTDSADFNFVYIDYGEAVTTQRALVESERRAESLRTEWALKLKPNDEERLAEAQKKVKMLEEELKYGASSVQRQQLMLQQLEETCATWLREQETYTRHVLEAQERHYERRLAIEATRCRDLCLKAEKREADLLKQLEETRQQHTATEERLKGEVRAAVSQAERANQTAENQKVLQRKIATEMIDKETAPLAGQVESLTNEIAHLVTKKNRLEQQLVAEETLHRGRTQALRKELADKDRVKEEVESRMTRMERTRIALEKQRDAALQTVLDLRNQAANRDNNEKQLRKEIDELTDAKERLEMQVQVLLDQATSNDAQAALAEMHQTVADLDEEFGDRQRQLIKTQTQLESSTSRVHQLIHRVRALEADVAAHKRFAAALKKDLSDPSLTDMRYIRDKYCPEASTLAERHVSAASLTTEEKDKLTRPGSLSSQKSRGTSSTSSVSSLTSSSLLSQGNGDGLTPQQIALLTGPDGEATLATEFFAQGKSYNQYVQFIEGQLRKQQRINKIDNRARHLTAAAAVQEVALLREALIRSKRECALLRSLLSRRGPMPNNGQKVKKSGENEANSSQRLPSGPAPYIPRADVHEYLATETDKEKDDIRLGDVRTTQDGRIKQLMRTVSQSRETGNGGQPNESLTSAILKGFHPTLGENTTNTNGDTSPTARGDSSPTRSPSPPSSTTTPSHTLPIERRPPRLNHITSRALDNPSSGFYISLANAHGLSRATSLGSTDISGSGGSDASGDSNDGNLTPLSPHRSPPSHKRSMSATIVSTPSSRHRQLMNAIQERD